MHSSEGLSFVSNCINQPTVQERVVFLSAIEIQIAGDAQRVFQLSRATTWPHLKNALVNEYKTQEPFEELVRK